MSFWPDHYLLPVVVASCLHVHYIANDIVMIAGGIISLSPSEVTVNYAQYAEFNCTFTCAPSHIDTIVWLVGHPEHTVLLDSAAKYSARYGLQVKIDRISSCTEEEKKVERIRINATSPELFNRTAVQCFVFGIDGRRLYSQYGVMFINSADTGSLLL